jgi:hypothetical protein
VEQLWSLALIALVLGPFIAALVYGLRHRRSGAPTADDTLEAAAMIQMEKDLVDMRTGGRGR